MKVILQIAASCCFVGLSRAAINEPPNGKIYFGAWLDTADSSPGAGDGDRPVKFNQRLGFNASVFQYAQDLPVPADSFPFPDEQVDATGTDALVLLTVYPRPNPWAIADADIQKLADQCARLTKVARRRMLLRFAPEMNGNWNYWGQQPTQFRALWIRVFTAVRAAAPEVGFVWAPSSGNGYPFTTIQPSAADRTLLDTNRDGAINNRDDPYSPYYPGDEYVDWVGASIYTYGSRWPWSDNISSPPGKFEEILNDNNFYRNYAIVKNKPYMVSETAATFHTNSPFGAGVGELETKRSWWRQYITNATFLSSHPNMKLICLFEFQKFEETFADGTPSLRDFRFSNKTTILEPFKQDLAAVRDFYLIGNFVPTNVSANGTTIRPDSTTENGSTKKNNGTSTSFGLAISPLPLLVVASIAMMI